MLHKQDGQEVFGRWGSSQLYNTHFPEYRKRSNWPIERNGRFIKHAMNVPRVWLVFGRILSLKIPPRFHFPSISFTLFLGYTFSHLPPIKTANVKVTGGMFPTPPKKKKGQVSLIAINSQGEDNTAVENVPDARNTAISTFLYDFHGPVLPNANLLLPFTPEQM